MNKQNTGLTLVAAVIAAVVVVAYLTVGRWLKYQAVDSCLKAGKSTNTTQDDKGGKYTNEEPLQYWYEVCMKEKGLMKK